MNKPEGRVLTIAASDSGGGAGIEADLKTFTALGAYGMAAVTAITVQNTTGVYGIHAIPPEIVSGQIDVVTQDIGVDSAKTGMLLNAEIIEAVAQSIKRNNIEKLVVDPVMIASSGDSLIEDDAKAALKERILPLAYIVTPNIPEAEALADIKIDDEASLHKAGERIHEQGVQHVLIKGGHSNSEAATDFLFDGKNWSTFSAPWIDTNNTHGTGCTLSAAISALLAKGSPLTEAVQKAKDYLTGAMKQSFDIGKGHGPLNHYWKSNS